MKYYWRDMSDLYDANWCYEYPSGKKIHIQKFFTMEENEYEFIKNLVAYAEIKDNCSFDDRDWKDDVPDEPWDKKLVDKIMKGHEQRRRQSYNEAISKNYKRAMKGI